MSAPDDTAPATKQDITLLMEMIGGFQMQMDQRFAQVDERFDQLKGEMDQRFDGVIRYIDVKSEQLMHDAVGVAKDMTAGVTARVGDHERRIRKLEPAGTSSVLAA